MNENIFYFPLSNTHGNYINSELLYETRTEFQHITVLSNPFYGKYLSLDNSIMFTEKFYKTYHELISIPSLSVLQTTQSALIIGGGDGILASELLNYSFDTIDVVDIDKMVTDVTSDFFPDLIRAAIISEKTNFIFKNAVEYTTDKKYNYIALDLTDPINDLALSHPLYQKEFFQKCANFLSDDGILVMRLGCPYISGQYQLAQLQKLKEIFQHIEYYGTYVQCYNTFIYFAVAYNYDYNIKTQKNFKKNIQHQPSWYNLNKTFHQSLFELPYNFPNREQILQIAK